MKQDKPGFPNKEFRDMDEYFEFAVTHSAFGADAYALKKKLDKQAKIPLPKVERKEAERKAI